tara:strand:- start:289 stop:726 length:438 start_codon:yes stop_codon:yes gene_type:complete
MSFDDYKYGTGLRNVGSYQTAGHPYVTGSTIDNGQEETISFPFITKSITVIASGSTSDPLIGITFTSTGSLPGGDGLGPAKADRTLDGKHYITMDSSGDSMTFDVKCKRIFIHALNATSGYELYASLVNIDTARMYDLTGSGLTD